MDISSKLSYFIKHPATALRQIVRYIRYKPQFGSYHINSRLRRPAIAVTPRYIHMGPYVRIGPYARIQGIDRYNDRTFEPRIILHHHVSIEQNVHITCARRVEIGPHTAIAAHVSITDIDHPYDDPCVPVEQQDIRVKEVTVGSGCKIYNGAVILPGVHIGDHCVIGANSVVRGDLPDHCVAVGAPARIVRRYDSRAASWRRTDPEGNFI